MAECVPIDQTSGIRPSGRTGRIAALDHLRGCVIVLVVLHHAVLAYCRFGHLDRRHYLLSTAPVVDVDRWIGFDILVLLNDSFFMPMMFLLSGLFVWRGLTRRGARRYLGERLLRLGLPFVVGALILTPLAYYPSWRLTGSTEGFVSFWSDMLVSGPWPSGPGWFIGVLMLFDGLAALTFRMTSGRVLTAGMRWQSGAGFAALVGLSAVCYLPSLALFGPGPWISFGPFAVQTSRFGLYGLYFAVGVCCGAAALRDGSAVSGEGLARHWARWAVVAVLAGVVLIGVEVARLRAGSAMPRGVSLGSYGVALVVFCAAACLALVAGFARFSGRAGRVWDGLAANAYGIYLLHYPIVTWAQYGLTQVALGAVVKAAMVFAAALGLSWLMVSVMRRIPGVARVV
jgi:peptidoglycan/LPS O-acetylase OafA/YrhL